ncbi:MAG TPA: hypothetical protein PLI95_18330 [Polyangiaceae bacterium]|nr:hypothetical protein [Polyangiaceae bacterium]
MSESQQTLPPGWVWATVEDLGEVTLGRQRSPRNHAGPYMRPYLRVANVFENRIDTSDIMEMNFDPGEFERFALAPGDVLLNEGQSLDLVGRPAMYRGEVPGACFTNTLVRFRPMPGVSPEFALAMFRHFLHTGKFQPIARWTTNIAHLGAGRFAQMACPLAPTAEQDRLTSELASYESRLDDAVATLKRVQQNLDRYRASVLKAAVEGRLVPTEAELARREGRDYEPASVLLERILDERRRRWIEDAAEKARAKAEEKTRKAGKPWTPKDDTKTLEQERLKAAKKYKEPEPPDTSDLPDLQEGWCWATVAQLASGERHSLTDGPFGSNLKTEHYTAQGPRVVRLQNIGDGVFFDERAHISREHYKHLLKHAVQAGDILIRSLGEEIPTACLVPNWLGPAIVKADCLRFAPNPSVALAGYLMNALNSPPTRTRTESLIHGVGRPRVGLSLLRNLALPLPPLAEQRRVLEEIERRLSVAAQVLATHDAQTGRLGRLRQSILKWAFEGRLVPQDPNDEPASVLLERIQAERAKVAARPERDLRGRGTRRVS